MIPDATVDQVLHSVAPDVGVDRRMLERLLRERPHPEAVASLFSAPHVETIRALVLYVGVSGSMRDCPLLAMCLNHNDPYVAALAEWGLWRIWMHSGTARGVRYLAEAIDRLRNGECGVATHLLDILIEEEPDFAEAHFQRGLALMAQDEHTAAADSAREALRLNPYHHAAAAALGHCCVEQGDFGGALHFYRRSLKMNPRQEELRAAVRKLEDRLGPELRGG